MFIHFYTTKYFCVYKKEPNYYNGAMKKNIIIPIVIGAIVLTTAGGAIAFSLIKIKEKQNREKWEEIFKQHYEDRVNLFIEENKTAKDIDVVFLGDSLTEGYDVQKFYPEFNALNRGIGGDTTFGVEKRLKESVYDAHPKLTAMLIGANNFDTMFENYENILKSFKEQAPNMKVVLLSLTSMTKEWGRNNQKAIKNNEKIKEYASEYEFTFVDLYTPLLDENTNELKEEYTIDGGHLTEEGYTVVTNTVSPVLHQLLD